MSSKQKFGFLLLALLTMLCLGTASVMMGDYHPWYALILFVAAFIVAGFGFAVKGKLRKQGRSS